ncbi:Pyruvate-formate lyase-activating enzyme [Candidatus Terasakiella magnetica]|uniref:Pyruvate-formate lyase-activating enzyme n=1 Tax=Candidatus Terasakiella magnetica TaxID=1867952 RepID=A0A1C3RK58_9PROT|nr:AmmeMemoRadiSam system radical SAM enzyme [Candidatus Terasakiella magnetica]SCA57613.1 Pyruvate-formate lyase-activating enzyme [Candidatus Terasakiella magnetica]
MDFPARYWHALEDGRIQCDLCPRDCKIKPGQRGLCFVRANIDGKMALTTYGRSSGFCIDPVEKKPLNHFYPGTPILSFGTAGCNLTCKFCQNHDISKSRAFDKLQSKASPEMIAQACVKIKCKSVAFTYNDPVIFLEYAVDVAKACRARGIKTVAVSAGYIHDEARKEFFSHMDAANIDLKAFQEEFYHKLCSAHLDNILETLVYLKHETNVWFEITDLLIPGENDSAEEIDAMTKWVVKELGVDVPMHFSAFHPDWKMLDKPRTPAQSLIRAREIALKNGVRYAYTGNVHHEEGDTTYCHGCGEVLIKRDWYELSQYNLTSDGKCLKCGEACAGRFEGEAGDWGRKRMPLRFR